MANTFHVEFIWADENDVQVGVRLSDCKFQKLIDVPRNELLRYKGLLDNAVVMDYGVRGKAGMILEKRRITKSTDKEISTYTLMHMDDTVLKVFTDQNRVEITNMNMIPIALRNKPLTVNDFLDWLNRRIDNLSRTYMNRVYIARKVGRDREAILRDSCGISIIDNYWIRRSDISTTWEELKSKRDKSIELSNTALTGEVTQEAYKKAIEDTTSLFTIKGAFPKAVLEGYLLKKDYNAKYEYAAYVLGKALGVSVAEASVRENEIIACKIFTSDTDSMAHASDILRMIGSTDSDNIHKIIYDYFNEADSGDIVKQLERLYLLNYIVINIDFHGENFGLQYNAATFEINGVCPAYDFNSAFEAYDDVSVYYEWIFENLKKFLKNNPDIKENIRKTKEALTELSILSDEQKLCVGLRLDYLDSLLWRKIK